MPSVVRIPGFHTPANMGKGGFLFHAGAAFLLVMSVASSAGADQSPAGIARGKTVYETCRACHSENRNRVGPRHCGINGRPAGGVTEYAYSEALQSSGLVWKRKTLDRFLAAPMETVPGTTMTYDGIKDDKMRADLITYLLSLPPCPPSNK